MKNFHTFLCLAVSLLLPTILSHADDHKGVSSLDAAGFDTMMKEISNWGRWGEADQLGTLNLITAAKKAQAAALVRSGVSISLALPMNKVGVYFSFRTRVWDRPFGNASSCGGCV